jgi:hypothetical protein
MKAILMVLLAGLAFLQPGYGQFESDVIKTSEGDLQVFSSAMEPSCSNLRTRSSTLIRSCVKRTMHKCQMLI